MPTRLVLDSHSADDTAAIGAAIGRRLRGGDVLGVAGDLGAGKTEFVRGLARGLDIAPGVIYSPSFTLVAEHRGRLTLNHIDLFRFATELTAYEEQEIGIDDYLAPSGVTVVEWFRKLARPRSVWTAEVDIDVGDASARTLRIEGATARATEILEGLDSAWR
jgi:tRNA threonylcarbamoyladenosine biosynthesis protein TsaE